MLLLLLLFQAVCGNKIKKNKVPNVTIVTFVPGCLLEKKKRKLPMLLLLPLFQGICGNKIKKTQSSQCYYCYLCSTVLVKKEKKKVTNVTNITIIPGCLKK